MLQVEVVQKVLVNAHHMMTERLAVSLGTEVEKIGKKGKLLLLSSMRLTPGSGSGN